MKKYEANGINYYCINLSQFKEDVNFFLDCFIGNGGEAMEIHDFANEIGFMIESGSVAEAEEIYENFCSGLHHGIGLGHETFNERKDIDKRIASRKKQIRKQSTKNTLSK